MTSDLSNLFKICNSYKCRTNDPITTSKGEVGIYTANEWSIARKYSRLPEENFFYDKHNEKNYSILSY